MPLKLKSANAQIKRCRVRREGGEKGKIAAMILILEGTCNKSNVPAIFNTEDPPNFWEPEGRKAPLWPHLGDMKSSVEYGGAKVEFLGQALTDCTLRNFVVCAQEGEVIGFSFEVKSHPTKAQVGIWEVDLAGEIGKLSVTANILLDPSPDGEEEEEEEAEADLFEKAKKL